MNGPSLVPPYCGANQQAAIAVPATTAYRETWEESTWVMPPYQQVFPNVPNDQFPPPPAPTFLPPPIQKTDLWRAMQTWPM